MAGLPRILTQNAERTDSFSTWLLYITMFSFCKLSESDSDIVFGTIASISNFLFNLSFSSTISFSYPEIDANTLLDIDGLRSSELF